MAAPLLAESSGASSLKTNEWVADYVVSEPPRPSDIARLSCELDDIVEAELTGAQSALGGTCEEILLAALGRTVARTMGDGVLALEVNGGPVGPRTVSMPCDSRRDRTGQELLATAQRALAEARRGPGHVDIGFAYGPADTADGGHRLALQVHHHRDAVQLDWRYDARSFDQNTVQELAEQFSFALIEVTSG